MARLLRTALHRARDEQGGFLIEVMATCLLLAIVGGGTLAFLDSTQQQSGVQRARAVAADLAQSRLDELRGLPFEQLRATTEVRTRVVDEVPYTVTPTVVQRSATDTAGACATDRGRDVLQVAVSVTAAQLARVRPVRLETYVAAPVGSAGSIRVVVVDSRAQPVDGVTVSAGGRAATTAAGCAQLFLPAGTHELTVSRAGWTTPNSLGVVTQQVTVAPEKTTSISVELDRPGSARLRFRYRPLWTATAEYDSDPLVVQLAHSGLDAPRRVATGSGVFPTADPWELRVDGLYPFTGAYSVWAGMCASAATVTVPSGATSARVDVPLYALNVRLRSGANPVPSDTRVRVRNTSCDGTVWQRSVTPSTTNGSVTNRRFILQNGFPLGSGYEVCAQAGGRHAVVTGLRTATGFDPATLPAETTLNLNPGIAGSCPW